MKEKEARRIEERKRNYPVQMIVTPWFYKRIHRDVLERYLLLLIVRYIYRESWVIANKKNYLQSFEYPCLLQKW